MKKFKRILKTMPLTIVAFLFWAISLSFNMQTGYDLGHGDIIMIVTYMALAFAGDLAKAVLAGNLRSEIAARQWGQLAGTLVGLVLCVVLSLYAAFSQRAKAIEADYNSRVALSQQRLAITSQITPLATQQKEAATARPLATIEQDIAEKKRLKNYRSSRQCTNATVTASQNFCRALGKLDAEKRQAVMLPGLERQLIILRGQLTSLPVAANTGDAPTRAIADILKQFSDTETDIETISGLVMLVLTLMVEILATLMPMKQASLSAPVTSARKEPVKTVVPADGRKLKKHEALDWLLHRAADDERVHWIDEDTFLATNNMLADVWGISRSTANGWITSFSVEKLIKKNVTGKGMKITITA